MATKMQKTSRTITTVENVKLIQFMATLKASQPNDVFTVQELQTLVKSGTKLDVSPGRIKTTAAGLGIEIKSANGGLPPLAINSRATERDAILARGLLALAKAIGANDEVFGAELSKTLQKIADRSLHGSSGNDPVSDK